MTQTYFLGANSREGFASLYRYFPGSERDFLHIIKGGPGTGKSSFMRQIGHAAEEKGLDVQYVLCSGDPDSLDGLYIPALRLAWVDGTAPHVSEPRSFGVDADYVNLGVFCNTPFDAEDQARIEQLTQAYKAFYRAAYRELASARMTEAASCALAEPAELLSGVSERDARPCLPERRFLRAVSWQGELVLSGEIEKLCRQIQSVPASFLFSLSRELERRSLPAVRCPSPLEPSRLEAILLPWAGLAFTADIQYSGLEPALEKLRSAKLLHDQLEAVVRPYMDFGALTEYTEDTIREVLG